jgi:endonuclease G
MMDSSRLQRLKTYLERIWPESTLESVAPEEAVSEATVSAKGLAPETVERSQSALEKLRQNRDLSSEEQFTLEAIVIPDKRPAIDIIDGTYHIVHPLWTHFETNADIAARLRKAIPSIGRIELPGHPSLPYGGTGFVVGENLLMTNRHVAAIFASGLGTHDLVFMPGLGAAIDFKRERDRTDSVLVQVQKVVMIHPYWDMALLQVSALPAAQQALTLSLTDPHDLEERDVAAIGYPAFDPRNPADVQNNVFGGVYYVKRLQPGKMRPRADTASFGKTVSAAVHDSSTLGGNSGSAVISADTGQVLALHFGGVYLQANYAVPTSELASDERVIDAGVNFAEGAAAKPTIWDDWWRKTEATETPSHSNA